MSPDISFPLISYGLALAISVIVAVLMVVVRIVFEKIEK